MHHTAHEIVEHKPEQAHPRIGGPELPGDKLQHFRAGQQRKTLAILLGVFLQDLAGNAFHIGCASAMLLSMFCSVGEAHREKDSPALPDSVKHLACSTLSSHESEQMSAVDADIALDALWT